MANLTEDDIDLGWNTKNDLPDEIIDATFILEKGQISKPIESSFGWHILKIIDSKERKEVSYKEVEKQFENELFLKKEKKLYLIFKMSLKIYWHLEILLKKYRRF